MARYRVNVGTQQFIHHGHPIGPGEAVIADRGTPGLPGHYTAEDTLKLLRRRYREITGLPLQHEELPDEDEEQAPAAQTAPPPGGPVEPLVDLLQLPIDTLHARLEAAGVAGARGMDKNTAARTISEQGIPPLPPPVEDYDEETGKAQEEAAIQTLTAAAESDSETGDEGETEEEEEEEETENPPTTGRGGRTRR